MLDTTAVKIYKYLAVNSSNNIYRGSISEIARATGLSGMDILKALSLLEEEKYVQVIHSPVNLAVLFMQLAGALLRAEAGFVETLRGLRQIPIESARKAVETEKDLALKLLKGTEFEELLAIDIIAVLEELDTLNSALSKAFSHFINLNPPSTLEGHISIDNSIKYLRRLGRLIDMENVFTNEDIASLAAALSVFIEIPVKRRTIMSNLAQQTMRNLEDLEQSLEEVEARILIEGATPELVNMRMHIKNQVDLLMKSLTSAREREVYFIEKNEVPQLLSALDSKETFFTYISDSLKTANNNPLGAKVGAVLARVLELLRMEREILMKIEQKIS